MKKIRALLLFSGGLDSILAAKILQHQNIEVVGLTFVSYFFDEQKAILHNEDAGIDVIKKDISKAHLKIVKEPKFGHGKNLNPCIDCHKVMIEKAWEIKKRMGFDLLASGEVLGQRAFSQTKWALEIIKEALNKKEEIEILRPLSARVLAETSWEREGIVNRKLLQDISGKSRKKQIKLAEEFGVMSYPTPSGGCILTEEHFSKRLEKYLRYTKLQKKHDFELLKFGRHAWANNAHIILGKNKEENSQIKELAVKGDVLMEFSDKKGPTAIIRTVDSAKKSKEELDEAKKLLCHFSKKDGSHWSEYRYGIKNC